jgi:putative sterol carrier protein
VTISQSRATAVALAGGELSAQTAFMAGRLRIRGQAAELLGTADAFRAFDQVMRAVADRTER